MSNYKNAMRRMRKYATDVKKNHNSGIRKLEELDQYKGSAYYDQ